MPRLRYGLGPLNPRTNPRGFLGQRVKGSEATCVLHISAIRVAWGLGNSAISGDHVGITQEILEPNKHFEHRLEA